MTALAAFVVLHDAAGRVLLCERSDGKGWNLPGGGVGEDEAPWEAALRETREEIGVEAEILRLVGVYHVKTKRSLVFLFEGRIREGVPQALDETREVAWVWPDALPPNTVARHAERLRDYATAIALPLLKSQM